MEVQAAIAVAGGRFEVDRLEIDAPRDDEVLVKVMAVGICHTDIAFAQGVAMPLPAVLGHEGAGVVVAVGEQVSGFAPGDRVAMSFRSCGHCDRCGMGDAPYCREFAPLNFIGCRPDGSRALHGRDGDVGSNFFGQSSFADHALTYERNLVKVDSDIPFEILGPLGCGVQTGAGSVLKALAARPGSAIIITGGGAVGLSAVMGAAIAGCSTIIVLEPNAGRRELALSLGATHVLDPDTAADLAASVREIIPLGVDYAFDTTGIPSVLESLLGALGTKGVLGIVGITPPDTPIPGFVGNLMAQGHIIKGILEGDCDPAAFVPELIAHYQQGRLPLDKLIKTYPLAQINEAIAEQHAGVCVKAVLLPDHGASV